MRERRQEESVSLPIYLGTTYSDVEPPYGDGPWVYPSDVLLTSLDPRLPFHRLKVCWDELHPGPPYVTGGPLDIREVSTDQYVPQGTADEKYHFWRYAGKFRAFTYPTVYLDWTDPDAMPDSWGDAFMHGASAWNRFKPTNSAVDLGVFLGELREFPRMLRTTAKGFNDLWRTMGGSPTGFGPKSVADHWLNTQFGWIPFLSDLRAFYTTVRMLDKRLKQLRRDNGQWIRRQGTILETSQNDVIEDETDYIGLLPSLVTYLYDSNHPNGYGTWRVTKHNTDRVWFSGAFRYYISGSDKPFLWNAKALSMLFGLRPSPALVWNLTPWSWLIDWCSNAGDVIENISDIAIDNLCSRYAYVMRNTRQRIICRGTVNLRSGASSEGLFYAQCERKHRVAASPFGFALDESNFSARQWSILAALGISRLH